MNPFEGLWLARCDDCSWARRVLPETGMVHVLQLAGKAHMTESDGHHVFVAPGTLLRETL